MPMAYGRLNVDRDGFFEDALLVTYDRAAADAETMIYNVVQVLYHHGARISGIAKGRGLEQRVMELTE